MDIANLWRSKRADAPHAGAYLGPEHSGPESDHTNTAISVTQQCCVSLPWGNQIPLVHVTITSKRPGVAGQVKVYVNLNSTDGTYQGDTRLVGEGQFTATSSEVDVSFVILPSGFPVLGAGSNTVWADAAPTSYTLTYAEIACNPWVWWQGIAHSLFHLRSAFIFRTARGNR